MFTYTLTQNSLVILGEDGAPKVIPSTHPNFHRVVAALKEEPDETAIMALLDMWTILMTMRLSDDESEQDRAETIVADLRARGVSV